MTMSSGQSSNGGSSGGKVSIWSPSRLRAVVKRRYYPAFYLGAAMSLSSLPRRSIRHSAESLRTIAAFTHGHRLPILIGYCYGLSRVRLFVRLSKYNGKCSKTRSTGYSSNAGGLSLSTKSTGCVKSLNSTSRLPPSTIRGGLVALPWWMVFSVRRGSLLSPMGPPIMPSYGKPPTRTTCDDYARSVA